MGGTALHNTHAFFNLPYFHQWSCTQMPFLNYSKLAAVLLPEIMTTIIIVSFIIQVDIRY